MSVEVQGGQIQASLMSVQCGCYSQTQSPPKQHDISLAFKQGRQVHTFESADDVE